MKKLAPHVSNKQGSMLMLTLIVFMVILILGMTMITSMLYSQGENNMQINEQKAYYAAFSAVEAIKAYFLNPELNVSPDKTIESPYDLIEKTCTYSLEGQEIDEDTTVEIDIRRAEKDSEYILIEATGRCNGEESVVTVRMREEIQKGSSGGLYSSGTVIACNRFSRNKTDKVMSIEGNIFVDDAGRVTQSTIHSIDLTRDEEKKRQGGDLFIRSKSSAPNVKYNKLRDIFWQSKSTAWTYIESNKLIENIYFQQLPDENVNVNGTVHFHQNEVMGDTQFFMNNGSIAIRYNEKIRRLILSVAEASKSILVDNKIIVEQYIHIRDKKNISEIEDLSSYISECEQHIVDVMKGLDQMSKILEGETQWARPDEDSGFIQIKKGEEEYSNHTNNLDWFEEYYNPEEEIRLVFCKPNTPVRIKNNKEGNNGTTWNAYLISDKYPRDQIFFIAEDASTSFVFDEISVDDKFNGVHIYAPNSKCDFTKTFDHFKGSIIVREINLDNVEGNFIFEEPKIIDGMGIPGGTESTGSSSSTTYTYHFEEYVENDKYKP